MPQMKPDPARPRRRPSSSCSTLFVSERESRTRTRDDDEDERKGGRYGLSKTFMLMALGCELLLVGCEKRAANIASTNTSSDPEWFSDITSSSGLSFTHVAGTNYFMPDQVGSGVALFDYDNDGRLDIYFVQ